MQSKVSQFQNSKISNIDETLTNFSNLFDVILRF